MSAKKETEDFGEDPSQIVSIKDAVCAIIASRGIARLAFQTKSVPIDKLMNLEDKPHPAVPSTETSIHTANAYKLICSLSPSELEKVLLDLPEDMQKTIKDETSERSIIKEEDKPPPTVII
ncbi:MAG: hypothetical protein PHT54_01695 [Candidatus Nanoarchaeia archaeon]|nr:hypothetical protein [Candidatus Nanoarchaeia archaeon]